VYLHPATQDNGPVSPVIHPILSAIETPSSYLAALLEKDGRTMIEGLELSRVDLGNLEDSNSDAEDRKFQDNGENLTCGDLEALNRT
jgi:hypothetical protein